MRQTTPEAPSPAPVAAARFVPLLALLAAMALAGCVAPRISAMSGEASAARPLAPPAAAGDRAVSQVVRGAFGAREMTLNCVVSVQDDAMKVVGLNAMGVRLFTIGYDGESVRLEKGMAAPDALTPERLLADLQLVYWPLPVLQDTLRAAGYEVSEPTPGTRRLRRGDRLIAEVHYSPAGDSAPAIANTWSGRAWLVNLEFGYSLQIDSQPS